MKRKTFFSIKFAVVTLLLGFLSPSVTTVEDVHPAGTSLSLLNEQITFTILNRAEARRGGGRRGGGMGRAGGMRYSGGMRRSSFNSGRISSPRHNRYQGGNFRSFNKQPSNRMATRPSGQRPSTRPVQRPKSRPVQKPTTRPATRPAKPGNRPGAGNGNRPGNKPGAGNGQRPERPGVRPPGNGNRPNKPGAGKPERPNRPGNGHRPGKPNRPGNGHRPGYKPGHGKPPHWRPIHGGHGHHGHPHYHHHHHYHGGYYFHGGWYWPVGAVAFGAAAGLALGSIVYELDDDCTTVIRNGIDYRVCDGIYYEPFYEGGELRYRVVAAP